jgi:hypothetical protein
MTKPRPDCDAFEKRHVPFGHRQYSWHGRSEWDFDKEIGHAEPLSVALHEFSAIVASRLEQGLRLQRLEEQIASLAARIEEVEDRQSETPVGAVTVQIESFAPEPYKVKRSIPVAIWHRNGGCEASFIEANINSSGDTAHEAFSNLKELILDIFDRLIRVPESKLGPGPSRRLVVLREYVDGPNDYEAADREDS